MKYRYIFMLCLPLLILNFSIRAASTTFISSGDDWKYLDNGSDQGTSWKNISFNDSSWASGSAPLGYGDSWISTTVSYGSSSNNKHITTYLRKNFTVNDVSAVPSLELTLRRDDGAVIYINGNEVVRENMPSFHSYTTLASSTISGSEETEWLTFNLSSSVLVNGANVVAVEMHQRSSSSSDLTFDMTLKSISASSASLSRGPYLQMGGPNRMTVKWRTNSSITGQVRFGTSIGNLNNVVTEIASKTNHEVVLTGLQPDTKYFYAIGDASGDIAGDDTDHFFRTSPGLGDAGPVRIWVIGDSGTANSNAAAVYNAYRNNSGSNYTDLWLMLGDNAYNDGTDSEYQSAVFDMYPEILRQTPLWSCLGNHDGYTADSASQSGPYYDIFTFPRNGEIGGVSSGTEAYYSFDYGNIHFVCLDSYETSRSTNGSMHNWLENDLQNTNQKWIIAYWHHPPYTKGSHNSDSESRLIDMRENFLPLLESYGVDLVLSGHSHSYERSKFINGHYGFSNTYSNSLHAIDSGSGNVSDPYIKANNDGAVYIVAGASGKISGGNLNHPAMYTSQNRLGSVMLDINGDNLDIKYLDDNGYVTDTVRIVKNSGNGNTAPTISGTPITTVSEGQFYSFTPSANDADNDPLIFSIQNKPSWANFNSNNGNLSGTPSTGDVGTASGIVISVSDGQASDNLPAFSVTVQGDNSPPSGVINFNDYTVISYGGSQDGSGSTTIQSGGVALNQTGNNWKAISFPYNVTANTIIEFDFSSNSEGEIHGIGFDNDLRISSSRTFKVFGSQGWGINTYDTYPGSGVTHYTIPIGAFYTGNFQYLFFVADDDANQNSDAIISNVKVFEN